MIDIFANAKIINISSFHRIFLLSNYSLYSFNLNFEMKIYNIYISKYKITQIARLIEIFILNSLSLELLIEAPQITVPALHTICQRLNAKQYSCFPNHVAIRVMIQVANDSCPIPNIMYYYISLLVK